MLLDLLFKEEIRQFFDFFDDIFFKINISCHKQPSDLLVDSFRRKVINNLLSHNCFINSFDFFKSFSEIHPEVFIELIKQITQKSICLSLELVFLSFHEFIKPQILSVHNELPNWSLQGLLCLHDFPFFRVFRERKGLRNTFFNLNLDFLF